MLFATKAFSFTIRSININDGLSNSSVNCIFQDHLGFMWFGTHDGLNCYDGKQFVTFRNRFGNKHSLPYNYIYSISEDKQGLIWVATGQGVCTYNRLSREFNMAAYETLVQKKHYLISSAVNFLKADNQGNMFIGTNGMGLMFKDKNDTLARQIICKDQEGHELTNYNVRSIVADKKGQIWIGIDGMGVYRFVYHSKVLVPVLVSQKFVNCLQPEGENMWIGTRKGLYCYNTIQRKVVNASASFDPVLANEDVISLFLAEPGRLWIGTTSNGLFSSDLKTHKTTHYYPSKDGSNSISSETILGLMGDSERRVWIATLKGGVNFIDQTDLPFHAVSRDPFNKNTLAYPYVSSFSEDKKGNLWIGTDGGGVNIWQPSQKKYSSFTYIPGNPTSLSSNMVSSTLTDLYGNTWVATYGGGINRYDEKSGKFKHYKCVTSQNEEHNYVWLLFEDHSHTLWATTFMGGYIYRYDSTQDKFKPFSNTLSNIVALTEDRQHNLWAGNALSLIKLNAKGSEHTYYNVGKPIRALYEDSRRHFWIGTEAGGLIEFDRTSGTVLHQYTDADGLCNNSVLNILEDGHGNLWLSTFAGLSCFNPTTKKFRNFFRENGLQSNQFSYNAAYKLKTGEMLFGGIGGFTRFFPDSVATLSKPTSPVVYLTSIRVDNELLTSKSNYVKGISATGINDIEVPFQHADLSFSFSAVDYTGTANAKYEYFLENWDKGWSVTTSADVANYSRLSEGTYYLHVRRSNIAGEWEQDKILLKVVILPPFYRSIWAYLSYCMALGLSIYFYNRYRTDKANMEQEIKLAHADAEKEKELNEKKTAFFTNVSHEFRTPLTLIINPLKDYLQKHAEIRDTSGLDIVYLNAQRLLKLIDQLLAFKKVDDENSDALQFSLIKPGELCADIHKSFVKEAEMKNLHFSFIDHASDTTINADRSKLESVIGNLYSNAIKYTPEGGTVEAAILDSGDEVIFRIKDSGSGIPADLGNRLFDRFFRSPASATAEKPGFGIGLYLAKTYVEAHKGTITYQSSEGQGSLFEIRLPKATGQTEQSVIITDPDIIIESVETAPCMIDEEVTVEDWTDGRQIIIVVEDNQELREYIVGLFKNDYQVYAASNGNEGYEQVKKHSPNLVITDVMMDERNGIELCAMIKSDPAFSHIPVILLTALTDSQIRLKAAEAGADDYVSKPFEKDLLIARVKALLKNRNKLQQYFYNEVTLQKQDLKISAEYQEFLKECIQIINSHINEEDFNINKFTAEIGMSRSNLYRKVKLMSGLSISGFIRFLRLRKAAELMINTNMTISEISFHVGIMDVKYFRKQFFNQFGLNPSDYIKRYRAVFVSRKSAKN
ncbi:response regulator [Mucilaginibacter sp. RS28]|uniref:histidine kinase n=1 Tax=Mucilaginibacter straminoryzae TaxID=2932774 RepID=A0A9X1X2D2_9SPHI|nr:response regulator [Mucilaginibacter straminoryzae]